jgi:hypothetical protein
VNIDVRPAAQVIAERLNRLASGAQQAAAKLAEAGIILQPESEIIEVEVIEDTQDQDTQEKTQEGVTEND